MLHTGRHAHTCPLSAFLPFRAYISRPLRSQAAAGPLLALSLCLSLSVSLSLCLSLSLSLSLAPARHTLQRLVTEFTEDCERDLYKPGTFNASQAELDFVAGKAGSLLSETDFDSTMNPSSASRAKDPAMSSSFLADTDRQQSADL